MLEETFFIMFSIWLPQSKLSSIVTPSDFAVETLVTGKSFIAEVGETVIVVNLYPDPINMNWVLVIFRVGLFALTNCGNPR